MDKDFHRTFTKCPCCGSEDRFLEALANELKERGLAREDWNFHYDVRQGIVVDKAKAEAIPVGSEIPGYGVATDICMNCGCLYAVDITRIGGKKSILPVQQMPPNRAERRRDAGSGGSPFSLS